MITSEMTVAVAPDVHWQPSGDTVTMRSINTDDVTVLRVSLVLRRDTVLSYRLIKCGSRYCDGLGSRISA